MVSWSNDLVVVDDNYEPVGVHIAHHAVVERSGTAETNALLAVVIHARRQLTKADDASLDVVVEDAIHAAIKRSIVQIELSHAEDRVRLDPFRYGFWRKRPEGRLDADAELVFPGGSTQRSKYGKQYGGRIASFGRYGYMRGYRVSHSKGTREEALAVYSAILDIVVTTSDRYVHVSNERGIELRVPDVTEERLFLLTGDKSAYAKDSNPGQVTDD